MSCWQWPMSGHFKSIVSPFSIFFISPLTKWILTQPVKQSWIRRVKYSTILPTVIILIFHTLIPASGLESPTEDFMKANPSKSASIEGNRRTLAGPGVKGVTCLDLRKTPRKIWRFLRLLLVRGRFCLLTPQHRLWNDVSYFYQGFHTFTAWPQSL